MALSAQTASATHSIAVLEGSDRINTALDLATAQCQTEVLTVQPTNRFSERTFTQGLERDKPLLERGVRIRTLYQHTARYNPEKLSYVEQFADGKVEYRTIDELVERLIICDESVAFIPTRDDQQVALELRHPGARPLSDQGLRVHVEPSGSPSAPALPTKPRPTASPTSSTPSPSSLVEGHVDEAIARRLGMNVRTCRAHIAKLAQALGSGSRAQLGYLIAQSGILDRDH